MKLVTLITKALAKAFSFIFKKGGFVAVLLVLFLVECIVVLQYSISRIEASKYIDHYTMEVVEPPALVSGEEVIKKLGLEGSDKTYLLDEWENGAYRTVIRFHNITSNEIWQIPYLQALDVDDERAYVDASAVKYYYDNTDSDDIYTYSVIPPGVAADVEVFIEDYENSYDAEVNGPRKVRIYSDDAYTYCEEGVLVELP